MDIVTIEELIKVLEVSKTAELTVRKGDCSISLRKGHKPKAPRKPSRSAGSPAEALELPDIGQFILAPMVGIFHSVDGLASVGSPVTAGQVVGSIESMKLLNDVVAGVSGTVRESLVEDGTAVEYGQPLCRVEPA